MERKVVPGRRPQYLPLTTKWPRRKTTEFREASKIEGGKVARKESHQKKNPKIEEEKGTESR